MSKITEEKLQQIIDSMPSDFTLEEVQYELFVLQKLEKAEEKIKEDGKTYSLDEMKDLAIQWHEKRTN